MQWWDVDLTALFHGPQVDKGSALASLVDQDGVPHVFYIVSQQVHQWYLKSGSWAEETITPTGGPQVEAGTALCAFFNNESYVLYDAADNNVPHVHELSGSSTWADADLSPNVSVGVGSGISSFVDTSGNVHVFYIDSNSHVHYWSNTGGTSPSDVDFTTVPNGQKEAAATGSPLASYSDTFGYHVFYIGRDGHVYQLYFTNVVWVAVDLTLTPKPQGPQVAAGSGLTGFVDTFGEQVYYLASNNHVHRMLYTGGAWTDQDLTGTETTVTLAATGPLSSFADTFGDHVVYISEDQHVHQLYFPNISPWGDFDLTSIATDVEQSERPLAAAASALSSLTYADGEAIFYISADQHVHFLCYADKPTGITSTGLTAQCPGATAGQVDVLYNSSIGANGGVAPYTFAISGSLPGLSLNSSTGAITGTPTTAGTFDFTVTVTDATGTSASINCGITLSGSPGPVVATCPAGVGVVDVLYNSSIGANGGVAPYTFAISGSLPGLSLNSSTGAITGTPTTAGTLVFKVTVTDTKGTSATTDCAIVIALNVALSLSCPAGTGQVGEEYSSSLVATGGSAPYTYAITSGSLQGLALNAGAITGKPTTAGTINFTATVTDATGATASISCGITIFGTFTIVAVTYSTGATDEGPDGPATNLAFVNAANNEPMVSNQYPSGTYQVSGVTSGMELALTPDLINNGFWVCTAAGGNAPTTIPVTLPESEVPTIYVAWGLPFAC